MNWQAGDWSVKHAPGSSYGLGPPGMMFVLSAKSVYWLTFYLLLQVTINRGRSESTKSNCWFAEIDFLEGPGWCGVTDYTSSQSVFSTGAQYLTASCLPMTSQPDRLFGSYCSTPECCEGTNCGLTPSGDGLFPFGDPNGWPSNPKAPPQNLGCLLNRTQCPPSDVVYGPTSGGGCPEYAGLGGDQSLSFFELDPSQEFIFAFVVDQAGVWAYRWKSGDEGFANSIWPGIRKYGADKTLTFTKPGKKPTTLSAPCLKTDDYCLLMHTGGGNDRSCLMAGADGDASKPPGQFAWATLNQQNWWNLFQDTGQYQGYPPSILPKRKKPTSKSQHSKVN